MDGVQPVERLVVDCSVIAAWELPNEPYAAESAELGQDWHAGAVEAHIPDLLPSEVGSAFLRALR